MSTSIGGQPELTAREREVAAVVVRGLSNKEAARALYVSVHTVEFHLTSIYRKLGVSSRTQLTCVLLGYGSGAYSVRT
jgi:DNA-binding NarL/FixJ family response regulator